MKNALIIPLTILSLMNLNSGAHAQAARDYLREISAAPIQFAKLMDLAQSQPKEMFKQLRTEKPVLILPGVGEKLHTIVVVSRYADVIELLRNPTAFPVVYSPAINAIADQPYMLGRDNSPANEEKPVIANALEAKKRSQQIRELVRHLASQAIREGAKNGQIDVIKSVSRAVPLELNVEYFGFDGPEYSTMARWSKDSQQAIFHNFWGDPKVFSNAVKAGAEMRAYVRDILLPERRIELQNQRPPSDVISRLINLERVHAQYGLSSERIVTNMIGLLTASVETTSAAIAQSLAVILSDPDLRAHALALVAQNRDQELGKLVWEALRFRPINHWVGRVAAQNYIVARGTERETLIPRGAIVLASTESAMFDNAVFKDPDAFRMDRDPSLYLHFGYDYHSCLGADVASVMVPETVKEILKLQNVAIQTALLSTEPFPESFILKFGPRAVAPFVDLRAPAIRAYALGHSGGSESTKLCQTQDPMVHAIFGSAANSKAFCQLPPDFRKCMARKIIEGNKPVYSAYNICAYGPAPLSNQDQRKAAFALMNYESFHFLKYENLDLPHAH